MLNKAIEIANKAHAGQFDKGDEPYILHPLRVMLTRKNNVERICAVLHDVVEDSNITLENLAQEGLSEEVLTVLNCLTRRKDESYEQFIDRILKNETACRIKLADLDDNMDITRIKALTAKDLKRIDKYKEASLTITKALAMKMDNK